MALLRPASRESASPARAACWLRRIVAAVAVACVATAVPAATPPPGSPAALLAQARAQARAGGAAAGAASVTAQANAAAVAQSIANMRSAAQALFAARAAQTSAAAIASATATTVANGLTAGGLVVDPNAVAGNPGYAAHPDEHWLNANLPTSRKATNGRTQVTVTQTAQTAVLTWQSFNVGAQTDLNFDQSAGGSSANTWVALNRVLNPSTAPSQILGHVSAPGQVYVIDPNGIIFGGASQVDVGALIASTADLAGGIAGQYKQFQSNGIYSQLAALAAGSKSSSGASSVPLPAFGGITTTASNGSAAVDANGPVIGNLDAPAGSAVRVLPGAQISAAPPSSSLSGGGFVMLFGRDVSNAGSITAPQGQVVLAAGTRFYLLPGYSPSSNASASQQIATVVGAQVAADEGSVIVSGAGTPTAAGITDGRATNTGLLEADAGDVTMVGQTVQQSGTVFSTTTTAQRGTIHLLTPLTDSIATLSTDRSGAQTATFTAVADTTASVTLSPGSLTDVAPDLNDPTTAFNSQRSAVDFGANSTSATANTTRLACQQGQCTATALNDQAFMADAAGLSRIEITSGGLVNFGGGSLTMAQAGQIAVAAGAPQQVATSAGQVFVAAGAQLDVSGVPDVVLPASAEIVDVNVQSVQLADAPANRVADRLQGADIFVNVNDLTTVPASVTDPGGGVYTPGGLLNVSGDVANVPHTIAEWSTVGGSVTLAANQVVAQRGSVVNLAGGSIDYQGGRVPVSYLVGPGGAIYPVATAPAGLTYSGLYNGFTVSQPAWGVSTTYRSPLVAPAFVTEAPFTVGRDAGALTLNTPTLLFEGRIDAGVVTGPYQNQAAARGATVDPFQLPQTAAPLAGQVSLTLSSLPAAFVATIDQDGTTGTEQVRTDVQLGSTAAEIADDLGPGEAVPAARTDTAWIGPDVVNASPLGALNVTSLGGVSVDSPLTFAPGATVSLVGSTVDVNADISVRGGSVTLGEASIFTGAGTAQAGTASVTIGAGVAIDARGLWTNLYFNPSDSLGAAYANGGTVTADAAGAVTLGTGSSIDVSGGGTVSTSGGLGGGKGGSVTLTADDPNGQFSQFTALTGPTVGGRLPALDTTKQTVTTTTGTDAAGRPFVTVTTVTPFVDPGSPDGTETVVDTTTDLPDGTFQEVVTTTAVSTGGTVTQTRLASGETNTKQQAPLTLDGRLSGFGTSGGGTLSVTAPAVAIADTPDATAPAGLLTLTPGFFQRGFTKYAVNSDYTLANVPAIAIAPGTTLDLAQPSYVALGDAALLPAGSDPAAAYALELLPAVTPNRTTAALSARPGASVSFVSGTSAQAGSHTPLPDPVAFVLGAGASITADPSQSVSISGLGSIDIEGSITAHGGSISVTDTQPVFLQPPASGSGPYSYDATAAIWFGASSLLDVSGIAETATDTTGRPFGTVLAGGSITVGELPTANGIDGALAPIVIQQGAVFDASGTSAVIDPSAGLGVASSGLGGLTPVGGVLDATSGGTITLSSEAGIFADGTLRAPAGGPGAAGGTLAIYLDPQITPGGVPVADLPAVAVAPVQLTISPTQPMVLPAGLAFGDAIPAASGGRTLYGQGNLGDDTVASGGFGTLNLNVRGAITFDGSQTLRLPQAIEIGLGNLSESDPHAAVVLAAPYVLLADGPPKVFTGTNGTVPAPQTNDPTAGNLLDQLSRINNAATVPTGTGTLTIAADRIEVRNAVGFGIGETYAAAGPSSTGTQRVTVAAFGTVTLDSAGAIQFDDSGNGAALTNLASIGQLVLRAAQIFPTGGGSATVSSDTELSIERGSAATPTPPLQAGGNLAFYAPTIAQDGVIQVPLGNITLGDNGQANDLSYAGGTTRSVELGPDSVTSVSAAGLTIPYGGTPDSISYAYNGGSAAAFSPSVTLAGQQIVGDSGSVIDLRGGGTLLGGTGELCSGGGAGCTGGTLASQGFVAGRGGSIDVLVTPLLLFNPNSTTPPATTVAANGSNGIYAILPGYNSDYAPSTALDRSSTYFGQVPAVGEQITIGAGVPGLPAGTYTLLPSTYALLPGAYRVQLSTARATQPQAFAIGNGTYQAIGRLGVANTDVVASLPQTVYVTPAAAVTTYSQYNTETYDAFRLAQATLSGLPRPLLPRDGAQLILNYPTVPAATGESALSYAGTTLFAGADSTSYAGSLTVLSAGGSIEFTGGGTSTFGAADGYTVIDTHALDAFHAPRLVVGAQGLTYSAAATITQQNPNANPFLITGLVGLNAVVIDNGAVIAAPEVVIAAGSGGITIGGGSSPGGTIDTIGTGAPAYANLGGTPVYDTTQDAAFATFLVATNGDAALSSFNHSSDHSGEIQIGADATIATAGTLTWSTQNLVVIDPAATLAAGKLDLTVSQANFGTPVGATLADSLTLSQAQLDRLVLGDPALGATGLQNLTLTAFGGITFYGSVDLGPLAEVEFNTPAIYGAGGANDVATITVGQPGGGGTFVWNGVPVASQTFTSASGQTETVQQGIPQTPVPGGTGTGTGTLKIEADEVVLGYGPSDTVPTTITSLDRTILGFSAVDITGRRDVRFNTSGSLAIYQQETSAAQTASGGIAYTGTGGVLNVATPLLTASAGGTLSVTAGGAVNLSGSSMPLAGTVSAGLGASLTVTGASIEDTATIVLPAGQVSLVATSGDVALGAGARIAADGQPVTFFDKTVGIPGGSVVLQSATGNVVLDPTARVDVSSQAVNGVGSQGGSITITATEGSAILDAAANLRGAADAPGQTGGSLSVTARDFGGDSLDAIAANLGANGFNGSVNLDIGAGDLVLSGTLRAHNVAIAASGGSLTVSGTIDASGATPGTIALAAQTDLTLAGSAVLDAHATVDQVDSTGAPIPASNRADVSLTAASGTLSLAPGATIDVRNASGTDEGTVELYAPRLGGDDIAASAPGPLTIRGAASVALYAVGTYGADTVSQDGTSGDLIGTIHNADGSVASSVDASADTLTYFNALLANSGAWSARLAGLLALNADGGSDFHLRPAISFESASPTQDPAPGGNLTVSGDLDLHTLRYTSLAGVANAEPGALFLRASGSLDVFGSITDGFGTPPVSTTKPQNQDENGWVLVLDQALTQSVTVPVAITLNGSFDGEDNLTPDTLLANVGTLNYAVTVANPDFDPNNPDATNGLTLAAFVALPSQTTLLNQITAPSQGFVTSAAILNPDGSVRYAAGAFVPPNTVIPAGSVLNAGSIMPTAVTVNEITWPAGAPLSDITTVGNSASATLKLVADVTLAPGSVIPSGSVVEVTSGAQHITHNAKASGPEASDETVYFLRPSNGTKVGGNQQQDVPIYALAPLLTGDQSWSVHLVAGADLRSANPLAVQGAATLAAQAAAGGGSGDLLLDDPHFVDPYSVSPQPGLSVIRTGTGDLTLSAGSNIVEASLYGIYTAGAQSSDVTADFEVPRGANGNGANSYNADGSVLADNSVNYAPAVYEPYTQQSGGYTSWYPTGGGNLAVSAGGSITGLEMALNGNQTDEVGDWLWRQGGPGQNAAWFINFGTYTNIGDNDVNRSTTLAMVGFTGFGTLGGGNLTITAGGGATNIDAVVASTGRVTNVTSAGGIITGGTTEVTGGGTLTVNLGGALSFDPSATLTGAGQNTQGVVIGNLRGPATVTAASIENPVLVLGDSQADVVARNGLSLTGVIDPTRAPMPFSTSWNAASTDAGGGTLSGTSSQAYFSLWQTTTSVELTALSGTLTPVAPAPSSGVDLTNRLFQQDLETLYPPTLIAVAAGGDIDYASLLVVAPGQSLAVGGGLELAPSPTGQLELLAAGNIDANAPTTAGNPAGQVAPGATNDLAGVIGSNGLGRAIDISGAPVGPNALSNPYRPAYLDNAGYSDGTPATANNTTNTRLQSLMTGAYDSLFAFEPDTPATALHAGDTQPALVYAAGLNGAAGNIIDFTYGETLQWKEAPRGSVQPVTDTGNGLDSPIVDDTWYLGGKAVVVRAAGNVVAGGLPDNEQYRSALGQEFENSPGVFTTENLIVNNNAADASVVQAGGNIYYANWQVAGPGTLEVLAGGQLYQGGIRNDSAGSGSIGQLQSLGAIVNISAGDRSDGANIILGGGLAAPSSGTQANVPDWAAFAALYLTAANQANPDDPLDSPQNAGKVAQTYTSELLTWLQAHTGYAGPAGGALAAFEALPVAEQVPFLLQVYYAELAASGTEFNDPSSPRSHSYVRGKDAIAALFPGGVVADANGAGDITLFGNAGVNTQKGGAIYVLDPGGQVTLGQTSGAAPTQLPGEPAPGLITFGAGDVDLFANGTVELGQSRVFTTFGGGITIWSANGNVDAGVGSKTTQVYQPPETDYDLFGDVTLSPNQTTTGAGIATLAVIPGVPAGNVVLVAPNGVIDTGEAGIRSSGNVSLAAKAVLGTGGVVAAGKVSGIAVTVAPNVGALSAAGAASAAASAAAEAAAATNRPQPEQALPAIITVEVISFGGGE